MLPRSLEKTRKPHETQAYDASMVEIQPFSRLRPDVCQGTRGSARASPPAPPSAASPPAPPARSCRPRCSARPPYRSTSTAPGPPGPLRGPPQGVQPEGLRDLVDVLPVLHGERFVRCARPPAEEVSSVGKSIFASSSLLACSSDLTHTPAPGRLPRARAASWPRLCGSSQWSSRQGSGCVPKS